MRIDVLKESMKNLKEIFVTDAQNDGEILRLAMIAELDAITLYKRFLGQTSDPRVSKLLEHLIEEETKHVGELDELLDTIDPKFDEFTDEGEDDAEEQLGLETDEEETMIIQPETANEPMDGIEPEETVRFATFPLLRRQFEMQ